MRLLHNSAANCQHRNKKYIVFVPKSAQYPTLCLYCVMHDIWYYSVTNYNFEKQIPSCLTDTILFVH